MENDAMDMIIENVKINKQISWRPTFMKCGCNYLRNAIVITERIGRSLFVFITTTKRNQR
jgi:hypothetical protein